MFTLDLITMYCETVLLLNVVFSQELFDEATDLGDELHMRGYTQAQLNKLAAAYYYSNI